MPIKCPPGMPNRTSSILFIYSRVYGNNSLCLYLRHGCCGQQIRLFVPVNYTEHQQYSKRLCTLNTDERIESIERIWKKYSEKCGISVFGACVWFDCFPIDFLCRNQISAKTLWGIRVWMNQRLFVKHRIKSQINLSLHTKKKSIDIFTFNWFFINAHCSLL